MKTIFSLLAVAGAMMFAVPAQATLITFSGSGTANNTHFGRWVTGAYGDALEAAAGLTGQDVFTYSITADSDQDLLPQYADQSEYAATSFTLTLNGITLMSSADPHSRASVGIWRAADYDSISFSFNRDNTDIYPSVPFDENFIIQFGFATAANIFIYESDVLVPLVPSGNGLGGLTLLGADTSFVFESIDNATAAAIPEPFTLSLFGAGVIGLAAFARRKAKKI